MEAFVEAVVPDRIARYDSISGFEKGRFESLLHLYNLQIDPKRIQRIAGKLSQTFRVSESLELLFCRIEGSSRARRQMVARRYGNDIFQSYLTILTAAYVGEFRDKLNARGRAIPDVFFCACVSALVNGAGRDMRPLMPDLCPGRVREILNKTALLPDDEKAFLNVLASILSLIPPLPEIQP